MVNAWWEPLDFTIPAGRAGQAWLTEIDSYHGLTPATAAVVGSGPDGQAGEQVNVGPRSVCVLRGPRSS